MTVNRLGNVSRKSGMSPERTMQLYRFRKGSNMQPIFGKASAVNQMERMLCSQSDVQRGRIQSRITAQQELQLSKFHTYLLEIQSLQQVGIVLTFR